MQWSSSGRNVHCGHFWQINWIFKRIKNAQYNVWNMCARVLITQLCLTLCNPMDGSPPGSSVHEIFQAGILEWVAMPSSRGSSWPRDQTCICYVSWIGRQILYHWVSRGAPYIYIYIYTHTHTHTHTHTVVYVCVYVYTYMCVYTQKEKICKIIYTYILLCWGI